jgi:hypothetical protein
VAVIATSINGERCSVTTVSDVVSILCEVQNINGEVLSCAHIRKGRNCSPSLLLGTFFFSAECRFQN